MLEVSMNHEEGFCVMVKDERDASKVPYISHNLFPTRQLAAQHLQGVQQVHHMIGLKVEYVKRPVAAVSKSLFL